MKIIEANRVVFHSKEDLATGHNLDKAEDRLLNARVNDTFSINDLLEFYHIKLYFDNDLFLQKWDDMIKNEFIEKISQLWDIIKKFWLTIDDQNIILYVGQIEFSYRKSFWELMQNLEVYKKINKDTITSILENNNHQIIDILLFEKIVRYFSSEIRAFLLIYKGTAELLLSQIEDRRLFNTPSYFFPKCLTQEDKENIILNYIDSEDANLNYIRMIENSRDLRLSSKTKLKAQKRSLDLNADILETGHSWSVGVELSISEIQEKPSIFSHKNNVLAISYSKPYLDQLLSDIDLFHTFSYLFEFIDNSGLITLVSKENELSVFEKIGLISKHAYQTGVVFRQKNQMSYMQTILFGHYLKERNNSIENLLKSFISILNTSLEVDFRLSFASTSSSYLEKIRTIAPELEFLLKQYNCYVKENIIDFELLEFDSIPVRFGEILSLVDKKYIYPLGDTINELKYYFFSDQCMLYYIKPYEEKYKDFYSLLSNENIKLEDFEKYKLNIINKLIQEDYLYIDNNSFLRVKNDIKLFLIGELHREGVLSYWYYDKDIRLEIDKMVLEGLAYSENTLFTEQETDLFNYFLNKKEFTNGFDLRNKYLHGTNSSSEEKHKQDYYLLLRMMILVLLKIRDDVALKVISKYDM